jgi:tryptophan 7-halogenase
MEHVAANAIRSVVIVGGGSAGWMSAAALSSTLAGRCTITVVENPTQANDSGCLLPFESSLPGLTAFHALLGINEDVLIARTGATFKLGTSFAGWNAAGPYIHPFGEFGATIAGAGFHHLHARRQAQGVTESLEDYCLAAAAAKLGRFARPTTDPRSVMSTMSYGLHLKVADYAAELRRAAIERGATAVAGSVVNCEVEDGLVRAVVVDDARIAGDFFIDCTGAAGGLIRNQLETPWEDWSQWLICDRVVGGITAAPLPDQPLTMIEAKSTGWTMRAPLHREAGHATFYSSILNADEDATARTFSQGRVSLPWVGNCVAIGLSAAVVEPLESISLHIVQTGIARLLGLWPDLSFAAGEREEYNRTMGAELDRIRDFLIAHYRLNDRHGEAFWDRARAVVAPEQLALKQHQFESRGRVVLYDEEAFVEPSWIALFLGQGLKPRRHHVLADQIPDAVLEQTFSRMRQVIHNAAQSLPPHAEFLARCRAQGLA